MPVVRGDMDLHTVPGFGTHCNRCAMKALSLLKRVEAQEAVVIEQRNGVFPIMRVNNDRTVSVWFADGLAVYDTLFEAAAAWNGAAS